MTLRPGLAALLVCLTPTACGDAGEAATHDGHATTGPDTDATTTGADAPTTSTSGTDTGDTGATDDPGSTGSTGEPAAGSRTLVLVGGGTHVCSSAAPDACDGAPAFMQRGELPLRDEQGPRYTLTAAALAQLLARPELADAIKAGLPELPQDQALTYDQLLDELDLAIGLDLVPPGSAARAMILGYTAVRDEEVVDLAASSSADTRAIYETIVARAGGPAAVIGVISASSGDGFDSYLFHAALFEQAGAAAVPWIPVNLAYRHALDASDCAALDAFLESDYQLYDSARRYPEQHAQLQAACADPAGVLDQIAGLDGVFFTGGDQARHKATLIREDGEDSDTPEMAALRARHEAGALLVAGSSAGTAVQTPGPDRPMVAGGESYNALVWGAHDLACATPQALCGDDLVYDAGGGLGLFTAGLLDTHFSERGRQARLVRLALATGETRAFGVDENTALIAVAPSDGPAELEVLGEHGVFIFDLREAEVVAGPELRVTGVRSSYLTRGDRYDPLAWQVQFAADKQDIAGDEQYVEPLPPSDDILSSPNNQQDGGRANPREWARVAQDLCDAEALATDGRSYEGPDLSPDYPLTYVVALRKDAATRCFDGPAAGDLAFAAMLVDLAPE